MSRAVRAGLFPCVAPQRASAACRAGGQLLTTPSGSPLTGMIWRPSGFGVLGSGCGTEEATQHNMRYEIWDMTLLLLFIRDFASGSKYICTLVMTYVILDWVTDYHEQQRYDKKNYEDYANYKIFSESYNTNKLHNQYFSLRHCANTSSPCSLQDSHNKKLV